MRDSLAQRARGNQKYRSTSQHFTQYATYTNCRGGRSLEVQVRPKRHSWKKDGLMYFGRLAYHALHLAVCALVLALSATANAQPLIIDDFEQGPIDSDPE